MEEKERQIELQIQKEAKFLVPKAIAGQPQKAKIANIITRLGMLNTEYVTFLKKI